MKNGYKKHGRQFGLYLLIGAGAAILDFTTFFLLEKNLIHVTPEWASVFGQLVGFMFSFFFNTFGNFKRTDKLFRRFLSFFGVTFLGMIISTVFIHAFKDNMDIFLLKLLCLTGVSMLQFVLNKAITYKK